MLHIPPVFIKMPKMQFIGRGVSACSFCLNRSQLCSTNMRAVGLSSDPVLCVLEYFGQMLETPLTGPTHALIGLPNGPLVYTALQILLKAGIHFTTFAQIFAPICSQESSMLAVEYHSQSANIGQRKLRSV